MFILVVLFFLPTPLNTAQADCSSAPRSEGLVTSGQAAAPANRFGTTSQTCIYDPKITYVPFKIPTYADLYGEYFIQGKAGKSTVTPATGTASQSDVTISNTNQLIAVQGNLTMSSNPGGSGVGVVFVTGNLYINGNLNYGSDPNNGLIFIVQGDIDIDSTVTEADAVFISSGTICTASVGGSCPFVQEDPGPRATNQLVVKGNLISLDVNHPIHFRRNLDNNFYAAEEIDSQPKYFVILKDLFAETLKIESEITNY